MVYKEDVQVVVTFLAMLLVSWVVFLRFINIAEFSLFTLLIFMVCWTASAIVSTLHVFTPLVLNFTTISRKLHKNLVHAHVKNMAFVIGNISIWLLLGVVFYFSMQFIGYSLSSASIYIVVGYAAIIAGLYKILSPDHINASNIMSPGLFFSKNWRDGNKGAYSMGAHHALHVVSSYWVLALVLLLAGYANLLLLGILSVTIFAERISSRPVLLSRVLGMCFVVGGIATLFYSPLLFSFIGTQDVIYIAR